MQNAAVPYVWIQGEDRNVKVLSNLMVDINTYLPELNKEEVGITELVYYPKLMDVMELANGDYNSDDFKRELRNFANDLVPKHITKKMV